MHWGIHWSFPISSVQTFPTVIQGKLLLPGYEQLWAVHDGEFVDQLEILSTSFIDFLFDKLGEWEFNWRVFENSTDTKNDTTVHYVYFNVSRNLKSSNISRQMYSKVGRKWGRNEDYIHCIALKLGIPALSSYGIIFLHVQIGICWVYRYPDKPSLTLSLPRVINFNFLFQSLPRDISLSIWRI